MPGNRYISTICQDEQLASNWVNAAPFILPPLGDRGSRKFRGIIRDTCALGLVVVEEGQITKRRSWLIRPSKVCFDLNYVMLHGITADHVAEMPTFAELRDEVHSEIRGMPLVAHNASFDIDVLRHTLDDYKIPYPELEYYCTRVISQALWAALPSYGLELASHYLGLPFRRHAAEEDAMACAAIVLRGCSEVGVADLAQLAEHLMIRCGHLYPGRYTPRLKQRSQLSR